MGRKKKENKKRKVQREHMLEIVERNIPKCLVVKSGIVGPSLDELMMGMREIMLPYTSKNLKIRRKNKLKDFVSVTGPLGLTHILILARTDMSPYLKIGKTPVGPTLTFRIQKYSIGHDIQKLYKSKSSGDQIYKHPCTLLLNGFGHQNEKHMELIRITFKEMFPKISLHRADTNTLKRVLLVQYQKETDTIEIRQYEIKTSFTGINRSIKKICRKPVDLRKYKDISDYILGGLGATDSDVETEESTVEVIDKRRKLGSKQKGVKLQELGPRLTLQLMKIEDEFCTGKAWYHKYLNEQEEQMEARHQQNIENELFALQTEQENENGDENGDENGENNDGENNDGENNDGDEGEDGEEYEGEDEGGEEDSEEDIEIDLDEEEGNVNEEDSDNENITNKGIKRKFNQNTNTPKTKKRKIS